MATPSRKTDLSPLEAIVVERTLGDEARQGERSTTLARIQQLTKERQKLYTRSASHPLAAITNGARIRTIGVEIEQLWDQLRRERAQRRAQLERALNVTSDDDEAAPEGAGDNSTDAA
jgi:hypothetical protein